MCYTLCKYQDDFGECELDSDGPVPLDAFCMKEIFKNSKLAEDNTCQVEQEQAT